MLHVIVACPPQVQVPADLAALPACADLVELRLDLLCGAREPAQLEAWVAASPRPVLATVRSVAEGGSFAGTPGEAAAWLRAAVEAGAAWLDAEAPVLGLLGALPPGVQVVASSHAACFAPPAPPALPCSVVKHAGGLDGAAGLERFRDALVGVGGPRHAWMPTGPLAALRCLDAQAALLYGSPALAGGAAQAAPGLPPPLQALLDELRAGEVPASAALFGLLGEPPAWSPSPALHNAVFRAQGRPALYVPLPGLALEAALDLPFAGYSVTAPWKERALALADEAEPLAREVGAANTLVRRADGGWRASNTDVEGMLAALPVAAPGATAVVHGAGGTARAALVALREAGYAARVVARDAGRGAALAAWAGVPFAGARWTREARDAVLVNATPAGSDGTPVAALAQGVRDGSHDGLRGLWVLDAPYALPGEATWLAAQARAQQAPLLDGESLLLAQARGQAARFLAAGVPGGARPAGLEPGTLGDVLWLALRPRSSLVLVGLRGAGKTFVGRALARRLGRPFVDLDAEVQRQTGRSTAAWIERAGLEAFRAVEARALAGLAGRRGLVVATGGGVLERREHAAWLAALGPVAWLDVTADLSAERVQGDPSPRPLLGGARSPLEESRALKARRDPHYAAVATLRVDAALPLEALLQRLHEHWAGFEARARRPEGAGAAPA
ncbi:MAG: type I 3-dehydroquinate dehydratase [Planctomycetia bacterium]